MAKSRPSLLIIGHPYAAQENRKKLQAMAGHFDLVCVTSEASERTVMGQKASAYDLDQDAETRNYQLVRLPQRGKGLTNFVYPGLKRVMQSHRFDVVMVENEPWAMILWQARFWKGLIQPGALFGLFTWENMERPGLKGIVVRRFYDALTHTSDFFIAGNQTARELLCRRGAAREDVLVAAELGVDLHNHQPAPLTDRGAERETLGLPPHAFIIGFFGRLTDEKGIKELLSATEQLRARDGQADVHLLLLGAGKMQVELQAYAEKHPWMHLLPPVPHFKIPAFMRCLDVFVLGSKPVLGSSPWEEQFGHVLIEAMACGVVTVGSSSGAIPEVLGDPEVVFPWGDAEALRDLLYRLKTEGDWRGQVRERQLKRVRDHYSHDAVAATWATFIKQRLSR